MLIYRSLQKNFCGFGFMALSYLLCACGFLFLFLRGVIPDFLSIVVATILIASSTLFLFEGFKAFRQIEVRGRMLALFALGALTISHTVFTYISPSLKMRMVGYDLVVILLLILCLRTLLKDIQAPLRVPLLATAAPFGLYLLLSVVRLGVDLSSLPADSYFHSGIIHALGFIVGDILILSSAMGIVFIANKLLEDRLEKMALTDSLTEVFNRRAFENVAGTLLAQAKRNQTPAAFLLMDIDHFKQINDQFGHQAGDEVLIALSSLAQKTLRESDVFARYGGEEFIALLPNTNHGDARLVAERLRAAVENSFFQQSSIPMKITISLGISSYPEDGPDWDSLISQADDRLYRAKNSGRNTLDDGRTPSPNPASLQLSPN